MDFTHTATSAEFQWLTGTALHEMHTHDPQRGRCRQCGLPEDPCPFALLGWQVARQALVDPHSVPAQPPH